MSATDGWEGVARAALDAGLAVKAFGEAMGPYLRAIRDQEQAEINVEFGLAKRALQGGSYVVREAR